MDPHAVGSLPKAHTPLLQQPELHAPIPLPVQVVTHW
jgi:hypothetical protein